jgi:hypothetical protein
VLSSLPPERWLWFFSSLLMIGVTFEEIARLDPGIAAKLDSHRGEIRAQTKNNAPRAAAMKQLLDQSHAADLRPAPTVPATSKSSAFSALMQSKTAKKPPREGA